MSEHEEFLPLCANMKQENDCITCGVKLNKIRDGPINSSYYCRNCYWRGKNARAKQEKDTVKMNCYRCEKRFDWIDDKGNYCPDCIV